MKGKAMKASAEPAVTNRTESKYDEEYSVFLERLNRRFAALEDGDIFTTDVDQDALWCAYLSGFPASERQHYNCHTCREFVKRYGGLVVIDDHGRTESAMWAIGTTGIIGAIARKLTGIVERAKVTGVFLIKAGYLGKPLTGEWHHMAVHAGHRAKCAHSKATTTPGQEMAQKLEDYKILQRGLAEFSPKVLAKALTLLETDTLYRSERCKGVAEWLSEIHEQRVGRYGRARANVVWKTVAEAPPGWCHIRSTMIGTLLEDLASGLDFDDVARKFKAKMHPLQYQRPQSLPSEANVEQAEKIVEQLGVAESLKRRFAHLEDLETVWLPTAEKQESGGVFGNLKTKNQPRESKGSTPTTKITWEKFVRTVLDKAVSIDCLIPHGEAAFYAMITAENPEAPPIIQWDLEEHRNPATWYTYVYGSSAHRWGLTPGQYTMVNAVSFLPHMWNGGKFNHHGNGVMFVIDGCHEQFGAVGTGFFPEFLKSEFHSVRKTLEAYARKEHPSGVDDASACGLVVTANGASLEPITIRVKTESGVSMQYTIDRWD